MGAPRKSLAKVKDETEYYPHQTEGVRIMARMGSFLLADDMGLGKSLQALTVAAIDFELDYASQVIVVCPATLKWNWQDEIEEHTKFSSMVLDGTPKKREKQLAEFAASDIDVLIVNYEQVKAHLKDLNRIGFDIAIFDEAHYLKNPKAQRTKASLNLSASRSFLLTGSPVLNKVDELWSILHRIEPARFPSYWKFVNRYAVWGGYKDKQIVGVRNREELNDILSGYMIRRLKTDVLDLPGKEKPIRVLVGLHPKQSKMYKQAAEDMLIDLPDSPDPMEIETAMTKALRLKQICGTTLTLTDEDVSEKLDVVIEKAQEVLSMGEHLVMFTQFREVQRAITMRLDAIGAPHFVLNGDVPMNQRSEVVKTWGGQNKPSVLVAMLQVAGVGLNMTQASKVFFVDKLWVPKLNDQAIDRLDRIGQTQKVQVYEFLCKGTIEDRVETVLKQKRKIFDSLVEESDWKRALLEALREEER